MNRRTRFPIVGILALVLFQCLEVTRAEAKPDILVIMPDQMRGDCLSAVGHPAVKTPNLDALAREGVLFRRGYATVPSCIPARFALLTGQSPQSSGVVGFQTRKITTPTLPQALGEAGYVTVLVGRTMHQEPVNTNIGYQCELLGSTYVNDDEYGRFLKDAAPASGGIAQVIKRTGVTLNWWEANPWPLDDTLHPTAWAAREAGIIVAATPEEKPLFLTASFYAPHPPLFAPKIFFEAMLKRDLPEPAHGGWVEWDRLPKQKSGQGDRILLKDGTLRRAQAGYYGLIEHLDAEIAPLVAAFKARSEKAGRPWVIVFTTDHGEMMGDHGYFRKCQPYEGSANIPFIIAGSKSLGFKPGVRANQPVALEDIMPTLLALADVNAPAALDGVNLVPALRDDSQPTRDLLHSEHAPTYNKEQAFHALTDGHFKYIWRPTGGAEQLFNLDSDPREERDLAPVPAEQERLLQWRARLIARLASRPEGFTDGQRLIADRPYPAVMKGKH